MDKLQFKHKITARVRFSEVDMLGVCNNAVYINFFEDARLDYIKQLGLVPKDGLFSDGQLFFIVRNEINYRSHARYDDELDIYTRISFIKNSSFGVEHLIVNVNTKETIVDGSGVIVQVDPVSRKSTPLPIDFIKKIKKFEPGVKVLKES
ncbi:MAG: thioesterase family protein [Ignavibacteriaceae bacterium]